MSDPFRSRCDPVKSLPSWERGLKYLFTPMQKSGAFVAPLVGAWIEISGMRDAREGRSVAPLVGAWIEITHSTLLSSGRCVAPLVGAWIEISRFLATIGYTIVAPLVGAWIEICRFRSVGSGGLGRSPRGSVD